MYFQKHMYIVFYTTLKQWRWHNFKAIALTIQNVG